MAGDSLGDKLREVYALSSAEERLKREEFFQAVAVAFQDPTEAQSNIAYAMGRWGTERAAEILERETSRIGQVRGSMLSRDGWTEGASARATNAAGAIDKLPDLLRELQTCEERALSSRGAYLRYCRETGRDPERGATREWWREESVAEERQPDHRERSRPD
jgi:hypothetical protein